MPRGDRTGPVGMGPMTGRAAGYCAGYAVPGFVNSMPGRGFWSSPAYGPMGYAGGMAHTAPAFYGAAWTMPAVLPGRGFGRGFGRGRGFASGRGRRRGRW